MDSKPSDLFLGVIEIFGILIPGGLFVFLNQDLLSNLLSIPEINWIGTIGWIGFLCMAFILGHFLMGAGLALFDWIHRITKKKLTEETYQYYKKVKDLVILPTEEMRNDFEEVYYAAFSYIRLHSASAITELERQTAQFKLFRTLIVLFLLDIVLSPFYHISWRQLIDVLLILFSYWRFNTLFDWSYRLAFDFFLQIKKNEVAKGNSES